MRTMIYDDVNAGPLIPSTLRGFAFTWGLRWPWGRDSPAETVVFAYGDYDDATMGVVAAYAPESETIGPKTIGEDFLQRLQRLATEIGADFIVGAREPVEITQKYLGDVTKAVYVPVTISEAVEYTCEDDHD